MPFNATKSILELGMIETLDILPVKVTPLFPKCPVVQRYNVPNSVAVGEASLSPLGKEINTIACVLLVMIPHPTTQ